MTTTYSVGGEKKSEHHGGENGNQGTPEEHNFARRAEQDRGMNENHPAKLWSTIFLRRERPSALDDAWKRVVRADAAQLRPAEARDKGERSVPLEKQKLRAETWAESGSQGIVAGLEGPFFEPLLKDKEDGGAGEVAHVGENVPRRLSIALA